MKKALFILLSIALLCSMMTIVVYADSEAIAQDTTATTANDETSEAELQSVTTEPPISSGVYRFDSMYNTNMCMMVEEDGYFDGALVLQWNTSSNYRDTLFKVEYAGYGIVPATNSPEYYYVIRSMVNSGLGLTAYSSGSVCLTELDADNDNQSWSQYWVYSYDSGCDVWMNASTGDYLSVPTTIANGAELEMTSSVTQSWWQMAPYTGSVIEGIEFVSTPSTLYGGETASFKAYMYSSRIGVNGPVEYCLMKTDNYTYSFDADIDDTGEVEALSAGTVVVHATVSGMSAEATRTFNIIGYSSAENAAAGFAEEYYFVARHIHFHITALIYRHTSSGVTTYYYTDPAVGTPHEIETGLVAPIGTTAVAVAFIEPTNIVVEYEDIDLCVSTYSGLDVYATCGGTVLEHYNSSGSWMENITIDARWWTDAECDVWADAYRETWHNHCSTCPDCDASIYPD